MKEIRPNFDDLTNPNHWIQNNEQNEQYLLQRKNKTLNHFPVEVFPNLIQGIIRSTNECLLFPMDFIGASILSALSISIGNTYRIEIKKGWTENCVLYTVLIGPPGSMKSPPLDFALKPLLDANNEAYKLYELKQ